MGGLYRFEEEWHWKKIGKCRLALIRLHFYMFVNLYFVILKVFSNVKNRSFFFSKKLFTTNIM